MLRGLVEKMDPDAARLSDAVRRLAKLPCTDGEAHEWVTISEEDNSALGLYSEGPRSIVFDDYFVSVVCRLPYYLS